MGNYDFQTKSMPEFVFVLQNIMIDIVDWVSDLSRLNVAFKRITCNVRYRIILFQRHTHLMGFFMDLLVSVSDAFIS